MKKYLSLILAGISFVCVFALAACQGMGSKAENTEQHGVELSQGDNTMYIDEPTVKNLLSVYPKEALGLKKDIYDYNMKLSKDKLEGVEAAKIEIYADDEDKIEATFMYFGTNFYGYDKTKKKYLKLTEKGLVDGPVNKETTTAQSLEEVEADNDSSLHKRYSKYDLSFLKLPKDISEYKFIVTGATATASDKKKVYVVAVCEKDGTRTEYNFAIGKTGDYYFDQAKGKYVKLEK